MTAAAAFGVGGDHVEPVQLPACPVLPVLGPSGSGRSSALATLASAALVTDPSRHLVLVSAGATPLADWVRDHGGDVLGPQDAGRPAALADQHPLLLLVDGVDLLLDAPVEQACLEVARAAATADHGDPRHVVLAAGATDRLGATYRGLATELRRSATGLVLQPRHSSDGDLLGVPLPWLHAPPPGRGVLVHRGRCLVVQVGHTPLEPPAPPSAPGGTLDR